MIRVLQVKAAAVNTAMQLQIMTVDMFNKPTQQLQSEAMIDSSE